MHTILERKCEVEDTGVVQGTKYQVGIGFKNKMLHLNNLGTLYLVLFHFYVI